MILPTPYKGSASAVLFRACSSRRETSQALLYLPGAIKLWSFSLNRCLQIATAMRHAPCAVLALDLFFGCRRPWCRVDQLTNVNTRILRIKLVTYYVLRTSKGGQGSIRIEKVIRHSQRICREMHRSTRTRLATAVHSLFAHRPRVVTRLAIRCEGISQSRRQAAMSLAAPYRVSETWREDSFDRCCFRRLPHVLQMSLGMKEPQPISQVAAPG